MKRSFSKIKAGAAIFAASVLLIGTSCTKDDNFSSDPASGMQDGAKLITDKDVQNRLLELKGKLPVVAVYNEPSDRYITLDLNNPKSFNFSSPGGGASFSSPNGSVTIAQNDGVTYSTPNGDVQFVSAGGSSYTIITTPASQGGGGGGGVVLVGNTALEVNYVLCFNSGSEEEGIDLFDLGPTGDGFGGAIGIAGNFEQLTEMEIDDEDELDISDFFQGVVAFYAFDGQPSGSYPVVDFLDAENEEGFDGDLDGKGLAYVLSFQENNFGIFFSESGSVDFTSSSVEFNGTYLGITNFSFFDFEDDEGDVPDFVEVDGSGSLQCGG